ncbi:TetR family transcriptional regulator [Actinomadura sp. WMMB 499]|uniref:TetR/AcrR family transcriptional regulator n=1 Tax=Actinomadura sp. WMMB 499 TaxID=1219491 RepID=UPI001243CFD0|nr:TetR family transcriptional regulator [Actinomadura sp. WMMB 499]QFG22975.1 TetR family transcriptional regulator [Actinomadura sp. WMMB 499]
MHPDDSADNGADGAASRRGRARDPEGNRRAVLDAARRLFAVHGYHETGIRAVAAAAGVTPGLVMAYFGSKDGLFREVVGGGTGISAQVLREAGDDPSGLPRALARAYLDRWDRLPAHDPWPALIRSALTHPPSADLLRTILEQQVNEPLRRLLGDSPDASVRITMIRSILFGVIMERYVFGHEPAPSVPTGALRPALAAALATAVAGPEAPTPDGPDGADGREEPLANAGAGAGDLPGSVFAALTDCTARYQSMVKRAMRPHGVSAAAFEVLDVLRRAGDPHRRTMGEVAAAGAAGGGGLTQHADRLEAAGLILRERDAGDRRIVHLRLTAAGLDLAVRVAAERTAAERELLAGLTAADQERLAALLEALGRSLPGAAPGAAPGGASEVSQEPAG